MNADMNSLSDQDFKALIQLLDDDDPEVSSHVWARLMEMGPAGKDRLEAQWEVESDPEIQRRLEEVLHRINLEYTTQELRQWRLDGGEDLLKGWYIFSKTQYPEIDFKKYRNEVNRLVNKVWLELNDRMSGAEKIKVISHILFKMEGYGPNKNRPHFPNANYINNIVENQEGNAASLGLLFLIIAQQLNLNVGGVILPGYFILIYKDSREEFFIDVYNGGQPFNKQNLQNYLKQVNVEERPSYFMPTSNIYIMLNLIRTAMHDYSQQGRKDKVEEMEELLKGIDVRLE